MSVSVTDWMQKWDERKQNAKVKAQERIDLGLLQLNPNQSYSSLINDLSNEDIASLQMMYEKDGWIVDFESQGKSKYMKFKLPKPTNKVPSRKNPWA